jgi:hypothetical protein
LLCGLEHLHRHQCALRPRHSRIPGLEQRLYFGVSVIHSSLLDHPIGALEQGLRHLHAECPGGLCVDEKLESGRPLDWEISRLGSFEDAIHKVGRASKELRIIGPVPDQSTRFDEFRAPDRRQPVLLGERCDFLPVRLKECVA